eukprot:TRINITY_DN30929_c0_g1_i1.p1 TRINITY_DN30929_c0_g1~~TRINITY_DN30929_c0_g1_i1.p1  ORF type:complete len:106 (+),score=16.78 TRINITY_DN30929_c0_g1_i1:58-375(+)
MSSALSPSQAEDYLMRTGILDNCTRVLTEVLQAPPESRPTSATEFLMKYSWPLCGVDFQELVKKNSDLKDKLEIAQNKLKVLEDNFNRYYCDCVLKNSVSPRTLR